MEFIDGTKPYVTGFIGLYKSALHIFRYRDPQLVHIAYISTSRPICYRSMSLIAEGCSEWADLKYNSKLDPATNHSIRCQNIGWRIAEVMGLRVSSDGSSGTSGLQMSPMLSRGRLQQGWFVHCVLIHTSVEKMKKVKSGRSVVGSCPTNRPRLVIHFVFEFGPNVSPLSPDPPRSWINPILSQWALTCVWFPYPTWGRFLLPPKKWTTKLLNICFTSDT